MTRIKVNQIVFDTMYDAADYIVGTSNLQLKDTNVRRELSKMHRGVREYGMLYSQFIIEEM